jgi:hypothetical protein
MVSVGSCSQLSGLKLADRIYNHKSSNKSKRSKAAPYLKIVYGVELDPRFKPECT